MPESDIRVLGSRLINLEGMVNDMRDDQRVRYDHLVGSMDKMASSIEKLAECSIRNEEQRKADDEKRASFESRLVSVELKNRDFELYMAADSSIRKWRDVVIRSFITLMVAGIFYAAFSVNK